MDGDKACIPIGHIAKSHGLHGILIVSLTYPNIKITPKLKKVWLGEDPDHTSAWEMEHLRVRNSRLYLKLRAVNSREEADFLRGLQLFLPKKAILNYPWLQLLNYAVFAHPDNQYMGRIVAVDYSGPQARLKISRDRRMVLIPAAEELIVNQDGPGRRVHIKNIKGLWAQ